MNRPRHLSHDSDGELRRAMMELERQAEVTPNTDDVSVVEIPVNTK